MNKLVAVVIAGMAVATAFAESLASSASTTASLAGSSASTSLEASSGSSSKGKTAAAGDYRIEAVTVAADRPGMVRLALQPIADGAALFANDERQPFVSDERQPFVSDERQPFVLVLPQRTAEAQGLARGDRVSVRERAYGFEFARADTRQAFYLVLADAWQRELDVRPVDAAARAL
jgi:hypothetical protein